MGTMAEAAAAEATLVAVIAAAAVHLTDPTEEEVEAVVATAVAVIVSVVAIEGTVAAAAVEDTGEYLCFSIVVFSLLHLANIRQRRWRRRLW